MNWFKARIQSFGHAFRGLGDLLRTQPHARIHLLATVVVVVAGLMKGLDRLEWALIALAIAAVWTAEALNTAIEAVVDLVSPQWQELARKAKDVAAAAVLLATLGAVSVAVAVFVWPWLAP
jgi:hypothetical protein